jgi:dTDP-4-amino-4,6-dideoxygalactose transaminase
MIPFNKPYLQGRELVYIAQAVASGKISGDGIFTKKCHDFFEARFGFKKALLTTSCTDALEMSAILLNISKDDEVIVPSYTFVSSANAFALRGAKIIFCDSGRNNPNIDPKQLETLITDRTKAIVVVHYAGIACAMDEILLIANHHGIAVIEDSAQAIDSYYKGKQLGSIGNIGTFSFHETKNIISGEGGMIVLNQDNLIERAEIIREKGTNRSSFFRGEVDKYNWVDIGSSFLPSDIIAAYLYVQLENMDSIQQLRKNIWNQYNNIFSSELINTPIQLPWIPEWATNNGHMFYLVTESIEQRTRLISWLKSNNIHAVFHYISLHNSPYFKKINYGRKLVNSDRYSDCLVRLPLFAELNQSEVNKVIDKTLEFFSNEY